METNESPSMRTLTRTLRWEGMGIHTGQPVTLTLRPLSPDQRVILYREAGSLWLLRRRTSRRSYEWPVSARFVVQTAHATSIGESRVHVATVEHVRAALMGLRVGGIVLEVDGPEMPILDGSAGPFVEALQESLTETAEPWPSVDLPEAIDVTAESAWVRAEPADRLVVEYTIEFDHPAIGRQAWMGVWPDVDFGRDLAPARTFGFLRQGDVLRARGLARGASPENTVLLDDAAVVNPPLRFPDEFVRHKVLDLLGDLALLGGGWPRAHIRVYRGGHRLHVELVRRWIAVREMVR
jgi:UDP-3-O-[3-hydroxymyristoyl] N-acetylglucosamine deacetylase